LELNHKHPRYGYRRITALLRRETFEVNPKRVARIRREEGIKVRRKQRRMKRLGTSTAQRTRAERPRQVWSWDLVEDQTENGSRFRILTILGEYTRQCVAMHAAWSIRARGYHYRHGSGYCPLRSARASAQRQRAGTGAKRGWPAEGSPKGEA
jgi:transposase InsO family protein